ncbi:MucR family transcriptional regulator [Methylobacterium brachiatum]|uniref:MucR family transcriptional regulator n=1 Tax=Methylobacterium brachiatum TaxID=269660 RepID=UPI0024494215|nr:MucR family transcriptional regulator [Methylobacterium brachiatum]MDH2313117.1 MucR family transcriptional regulator [Methylobacterium brachiatum]
MSEPNNHLVDLTAGIVAAYVSRQAVAVGDLPGLMRIVRDGLAAIALGADAPSPAQGPAAPVAIRASIQPDGLVSFINGRSYKTLKRHLTAFGLTPEQYRQRYGLGPDYPMVAPDYAATRSRIAREIQLGVPGGQTMQQAAE